MTGHTIASERAKVKIEKCRLWIVQCQGGLLLTDTNGNRWLHGSNRTDFVAVFYTRRAANKAANRAKKQRPDLFGWTRVLRLASVKFM